jgi:hypothetical protein
LRALRDTGKIDRRLREGVENGVLRALRDTGKIDRRLREDVENGVLPALRDAGKVNRALRKDITDEAANGRVGGGRRLSGERRAAFTGSARSS